ncbi:MAG: hypothetical protein A2600_11475 [Candidatus Lambdaproteobacteria bacterium RIFOXYD1_FULL_56_27]|uniref:Uncharacterized protein n=1 Tax=Candidatus Lambdaproteobacteria bacterium RIFOXYD2_FULL_56_26 TaxID=1817773 RepID=A0A1F6H120_9PROT|nr:MAG: hypothetical protein A2516_02045 [Alphaproteobacteria bacterium RIFOXYD12_FULL_60_8]OGH01080.1 MAG: hypothetical protein A2426_12525 [Candidatus Lambdaproteobacteria bacterium RIFOXYC1_FULL_56_13]OGH03990.1 MAG: hypothetical protein A2557_11235 [Candidatus Lambdaproteobacteria bacterium RIFOXYD2_FULL_56_26]OGH08381.1 MAG: hypothetical protein A2600_11475 [Candidatus Lambdaproteobacteria bacterium RIFOXYD1_FULL_56_27]
MIYVLWMAAFVGGLFATNGGTELGVFGKNQKPQVLQMEAAAEPANEVGLVAVKVEGRDPMELYQVKLADGRLCLVTKNKQSMSCSGTQSNLEKPGNLVAKQFEQTTLPGPGLYRLVFSGSVECVLTAAKTGLSCNFGRKGSETVPNIVSVGRIKSEGKGPEFYQVRYEDGLNCLLPHSKTAVQCFWPHGETLKQP